MRAADAEKLWRAVQSRDAGFDGTFVFAVRSTGIYCRPSCPARRPRREQVVFFHLPEAAERAGFRSCQRCQPRMFIEALEKRRMDEELEVAAEIQMRLQPVVPPIVEGWEIIGVSTPCLEVGGDYYDFFKRKKDNRLVIALGDVAGKGVGAALLMSSLHAAVRAQSQMRASVVEVMSEINQYIYENTPSNEFLTLFYAELDPKSARLVYSNAGHNPPILGRCSGEIVRLEAGGLPIGISPEASYSERAVVFSPGDVLVIYSDGISESVNGEDEEFGESRLIEVVRQNLDCPASCLRDRINEALRRFAGAAPPEDDMSLIILKRTTGKVV
jgi:serine phosphatase RsbU (regulator of sigma subunit)